MLDSLGVRGVVAVCHAIGGSICFRTAYRHPGVLSGIVSLNGGPAEGVGTPGLRAALKFAPILKLFGGSARGRVRKGLVKSAYDPSWVTPAIVDGYVAPFDGDLGATIDTYAHLAEAHEPEKLRPHLASIDVPVELLTTTLDRTEVDQLRATLPDLDVEKPAHSGEFIQEENPAAVVAAVDTVLHRIVAKGNSS